MWMSMKLGLRNLWRRPGRTIMTVMMLFLSTWLIVFAVGMNEGTYADMIRLATGTWGGHFQVLHEDYDESPALYESIEAPGELIAALEARPDVAAATARLEVAGLLSAGTRTAGAALTGVMPAREPEVSTLPNTVSQGSFLGELEDPEALPIVLGQGLARRLRVELGDEVVYMGQAADGSIAAELFIVSGIMESGLSELDARLALIRLEDAQVLMETPDQAHRVVGRMHDLDDVDALGASLTLDAPRKFYTWDDLSPELMIGIESDRQGGQFFLMVIILMVALGVINTMVMAVFERTHEFGVMKAIGTSPASIIGVVLWESFWMALVGVTMGLIAGALLNEYLGSIGIEFFEEPIEFGGIEISKVFPANTALGTVFYPLVIFASAWLGGLWPALRAARVDPVQAIREV